MSDFGRTGSATFPNERLHRLLEAEDAFQWNHPLKDKGFITAGLSLCHASLGQIGSVDSQAYVSENCIKRGQGLCSMQGTALATTGPPLL